jgi:hypothetical protein
LTLTEGNGGPPREANSPTIEKSTADAHTQPWHGRRWTTGSAILILAIVVGLFTPTIIGGWAPVLHWTCQPVSRVLNQTVQIPSVLVNSPYGGNASGAVMLPPGFLPGFLVGMGTGATNGGSTAAAFLSNITVSVVKNGTVWGAGTNRRCSGPFEITLAPIGAPSLGIPLLGLGNISDRLEPDLLFPQSPDLIYFSNGFQSANWENISTCGGTAQKLPLVFATYLTLSAHFAWGGENHAVPFNLPMVSSQFEYEFPADFGTWQVDNLSAPGGPGGGWAFSYSPCP